MAETHQACSCSSSTLGLQVLPGLASLLLMAVGISWHKEMCSCFPAGQNGVVVSWGSLGWLCRFSCAFWRQLSGLGFPERCPKVGSLANTRTYTHTGVSAQPNSTGVSTTPTAGRASSTPSMTLAPAPCIPPPTMGALMTHTTPTAPSGFVLGGVLVNPLAVGYCESHIDGSMPQAGHSPGHAWDFSYGREGWGTDGRHQTDRGTDSRVYCELC